MSGEYICSKTIEEYWKQLKAIYEAESSTWEDISKEEYEAVERSERADSDNHLNEERLGKDTEVIDICHYKYLPDRKVVYKVLMKDIQGSTREHYFRIKLNETNA